MSVKSNKKEKSNIDYLRDMLKTNMSQSYSEEAIEFLEAIKSELETCNKDYEKDIDVYKDEISTLETTIREKDSQITELEEEAEYEDTIDTKMGSKESIRWHAPNLAAKTMMEELNEAISRGIPIQKIENILRAL